MSKGAVTLPVFQNLEAYWPGVLSLIGLNGDALKSIHNYHHVLKHVGFVPEMYDVQQADVRAKREGYPLRPELIESLMFLYRATGDKSLLAIGEDVLRAIQHSTRTACGYATVKDTRDHRLEDRMESFFLAETSKYLYLLFDEDNFIHGRGNSGKLHQVASRSCVLDTGAYIFNTEAHPLDAGALDCCYGPTDEEIWESMWVPKSRSEKVAKKNVLNNAKSCPAQTWVDFFLHSSNFDYKIHQYYSTKKNVVENVKKSFQNYSILSCKAAQYNEKLCINGEVCDK